MPRNYIKKTNRCDINENNMKLAIKAILTGSLSQYKAAQEYQVKRQTLQSRIKVLLKKKSKEELLAGWADSGNESEEEASYTCKYTARQVFSTNQELELVAYIKRCSNLNYGLNYKQIRKVAYDFACALPDSKAPHSWELNKMAGLEWLRGFMKRYHNDISLRKPENTSISRAMAFNKPVIEVFFEKYAQVLEKYKFKPEQIWNLDETGITTVMPPTKVVAPKGKKQVAHISSQERGELVTFVGLISAVGGAVPPVFVYPRVRNPQEYLGDEYPTSAIALGNKKGWMTSDLFPKVLHHFASTVKCSVENKVLLLLDNHESHVSVDAIKLCREKGIVLLSFPPHTTHRTQPLDVGVFGPFKSYLATAQHDWLLSNPAKALTIRHLARLAKQAYECAFTNKNITSSFKNTGLWPINRLVFSDADFLPSKVSDQPLAENKEDVSSNGSSQRELETGTSGTISPIPSTSNYAQEINNKTPPASPSVLSTSTSILCQIRPYPKVQLEEKKKTKRRKAQSTIYTDTPEYEKRKSLEAERKRKLSLKQKKESIKKDLITEGKKRNISTSSESSTEVVLQDCSSDDEEDFEDLKLISDSENIDVGNFVLVKFLVFKKEIFYVGQITSFQDEEYEIKFMRRQRNTNSFLFPTVEDISVVEKKDIAAVLPFSSAHGTARTSSVFKFNVNFLNINVR